MGFVATKTKKDDLIESCEGLGPSRLGHTSAEGQLCERKEVEETASTFLGISQKLAECSPVVCIQQLP